MAHLNGENKSKSPVGQQARKNARSALRIAIKMAGLTQDRDWFSEECDRIVSVLWAIRAETRQSEMLEMV